MTTLTNTKQNLTSVESADQSINAQAGAHQQSLVQNNSTQTGTPPFLEKLDSFLVEHARHVNELLENINSQLGEVRLAQLTIDIPSARESEKEAEQRLKQEQATSEYLEENTEKLRQQVDAQTEDIIARLQDQMAIINNRNKL